MKRKPFQNKRQDTQSDIQRSKRLDRYHEDQLAHLESIADRNKLPKDFSISSYCSCGEKKYRRSDPKCEHCMAMDVQLDHAPRIAWQSGDPTFNWDGYEAKYNDACYRCGKAVGIEVVPLAGWVCQNCVTELEQDK